MYMACKAKGNVAAKQCAMPKGVALALYNLHAHGHMARSLTLPPPLKKRAYELFDEVAHTSYLDLALSGGRSRILVYWLGPKTSWTIGRPS